MASTPTASSVAFVADSTLGLSPEEAKSLGIHVVPQQVLHRGRSFRDLVEIAPGEVLRLLCSGERLTTSQVAPEDLRKLYEALLRTHGRVVSVHVSGLLSGTVDTAKKVAQAFGDRVKVLDSWSLSGGLLLVLERARRLLEEGVAWEHLEEALALYQGPLLPWSQAPGVEELRLELEEALRQAVLAQGDTENLFLLAERLGEDLEVWEALLERLPSQDPRLPIVRARVARLRREYGV